MKIGTRYDLNNPDAKFFVQSLIDQYGISRSVNEIGLSVLCADDNGQRFELVQLNNSRRIVAVCGA